MIIEKPQDLLMQSLKHHKKMHADKKDNDDSNQWNFREGFIKGLEAAIDMINKYDEMSKLLD